MLVGSWPLGVEVCVCVCVCDRIDVCIIPCDGIGVRTRVYSYLTPSLPGIGIDHNQCTLNPGK